MKSNKFFKKGVNHKTVTLITALIIVVAGISYTTISQNNPVDSAKISRIITDKDNLKTNIEAYLYDVNAKSASIYYTNEEILLGTQGQDISIIGIADRNQTYQYEDKILYKLDSDKCLKSLDFDISKISSQGGIWYIDLDANPYLVFEDYDSISDYIKDNLEGNLALSNIIKY